MPKCKAYYNELEPFCLAVLKTLVERGEIPDGVVDSRDVRTVPASELLDYGHIHLFAGIGGFAKGFVDAGFPEDRRVLTFGFPCQDLSVAGKRGGLSASRSGLFFEAARIIGEVRPDIFVCENVPGLLSSNQGKDFQLVIQTLTELGYGVAWRILDSQYFGVAQRRRRVFIVGCLGRPCPAEILFESTGVCGNSSAGGEEGQDVARETGISLASGNTSVGTILANCGTKWCLGDQEAFKGDYFVLRDTAFTLPSVRRGVGNGHNTNYAIQPIAFNWQEDRNFRAEERTTNPLRVQQTEAVAFAENQRGELRTSNISPQLTVGGGKPGQGYSATLCPTPDPNGVRDFAGLPEGLDNPRYKALGNAVTTKTVAWIARRIKASL